MATTSTLNANRTWVAKAGTVFHCLLFLFLLEGVLLPLNLAACLITHLLRKFIQPPQPSTSSDRTGKPVTVLIDGGRLSKGLFLARICKAAGHRVIYTSTSSTNLCGGRFSSAIDVHYTVPRSHENYDKCASEIRNIILKEKVDLYIPVSTATSAQTDAKLAEEVVTPAGAKSVSLTQKDTIRLDDKSTFSKWCESLDAPVPTTIPVNSPQEAFDHIKRLATQKSASPSQKYLLKSIQYDDAHRSEIFSASLALTNPTALQSRLSTLEITPSRTWIIQQFIRGNEYCTHVLALDGKVLDLSICPSSHWLLQYTPIQHSGITKWIEDFVSKANLSGHICFDFIEDTDTKLVYCIECNPRVSTAVGCFRSVGAQYGKRIELFLNRSQPGKTPSQSYSKVVTNAAPTLSKTSLLTPPARTPTQYWLYHELILLSRTRRVKAFASQLYAIVAGQDALYDVEDPWPFFAQNHLLIAQQLLLHIRIVRPWSEIDWNLGRLID
ncbi:hypothetical protein HK097_010856 [Rhizophlyctis rosea]|uniref:ATP-grasp domain-containing protein n=1 Tax=Rhizophlyctis rosea TaxID=64517 RepID=A0AAD5S9D6_9FUNG|nr:hypothetical protein HK097_010856 [Rhizophlyctis rosea]